MKTIEERAEAYAWSVWPNPMFAQEWEECKENYIKGATEQKVIDLETVCNIFCHTGCPHKTDSYNCIKDKCDALKAFKRMMEE